MFSAYNISFESTFNCLIMIQHNCINFRKTYLFMRLKSMPAVNNNIFIIVVRSVYIDGHGIWILLVAGSGLQRHGHGIYLFLRQTFSYLKFMFLIWDNIRKLKFKNTTIINALLDVFTHHFYLRF